MKNGKPEDGKEETESEDAQVLNQYRTRVSDGNGGGERDSAGSEFDELTERGRAKPAAKARGPASVRFEEVEPWAEAVNGAELLDALVKEQRRFVVFGEWMAEAFALWILHTYAYRLREVTTYIGIESPEKECGKSTLLTVLSQLVKRPALSSNISSSALFRAIEELQPTLLIDEADTNLRGTEDLTGILNAGYTRRTAFVWRMCYDGAKGAERENGDRVNAAGRVAQYSCWCPKAIAGIGRLPTTLASRCIVVQMHRKLAGEACERLKGLDATELKRKCARFVADHAEEITQAEPQIPQGLANRAADIWEPLLVLAELAGGRWPELAREAAVGLTGQAQEDSPIGSLLLDICVIFAARQSDRIFSRDMVSMLAGCGTRPWLGLRRGKALTDAWLAQQLRAYGIRPRTIRVGSEVAKGYWKEDFVEIFRRYIPRSAVEELKGEFEQEAKEAEEGRKENERAGEESKTIVDGGR